MNAKPFLPIRAAAFAAILLAAPLAQAQAPGPPPEGGTEVGNWGLVPYVAFEAMVLRPEERSAYRQIEDRHVREMRALEDRYETDLLALRRRQADEREAFKKSLKR
ncbi:MAG: hypothetical protein FJX47_09675 [Alphaproteobacteria bacterium]|nr:hypothetical protein [Alphaproteobacteria bacterium]